MATTLKSEIEATVKWFADMDIAQYGYITASTYEIAKVQNVVLPENPGPLKISN